MKITNIKKKAVNSSLVLSALMFTAVPVFAEGEPTPTVNTAVTEAMSGLSADLGATLGAVAPYAISIFGLMLAWKYGKKLFNLVAK